MHNHVHGHFVMKSRVKHAMRSLSYLYIVIGVCFVGYQVVSYLC